MKNKGLLSILLSIAILCGCKKDNHISDPTCGRTILGQWKLVKTTGGLCGCTTLPTSNDGLTFNADSSYSQLSQGQTTSGRFSSQLVNGKYQITFSQISYPSSVDTTGCALYLSTVGISDGVTNVYSR